MEVSGLPNRTPATIQSLFDSLLGPLREANDGTEVRIKRWYLKESTTSAGEYIPGSWAEGNVITIAIITNAERAPKLPTDPVPYIHYTRGAADRPPVAVDQVHAWIGGAHPTMRLVSNSYLGQWCPDCNGYVHRRGCTKAYKEKSYKGREAGRVRSSHESRGTALVWRLGAK